LAQQPTGWLFARRLLPQLATTAAAVPRVLETRLGKFLEIEVSRGKCAIIWGFSIAMFEYQEAKSYENGENVEFKQFD
jgi:hypothetical protein